jgi:hypothetical protein
MFNLNLCRECTSCHMMNDSHSHPILLADIAPILDLM